MNENPFIDMIARRLRRGRPDVPAWFDHNVWVESFAEYSFAQIWFRTRGCSHSHRGGCTVCDYWKSSDVSADQMVVAVRAALQELTQSPSCLLLNACGSMLDRCEVPYRALNQILQLVADAGSFPVILETRAETITTKSLEFCRRILGPGRLRVEIGIESSNPWILRYCVNKNMDIDVALSAVHIATCQCVPIIANVFLGLPFLSPEEALSDALSSILWVLGHGFDRVVLFPAHIRPWTVLDWLHTAGLYQPLPLWALIDLLSLLSPDLLAKVEIAWTCPRSNIPPGYAMPLSPTTCPACYVEIASLLEQYRFCCDRPALISCLAAKTCNCRDEWREALASFGAVPLSERVGMGYKAMGRALIGDLWWQENGTEILRELRESHLPCTAHGIVGKAEEHNDKGSRSLL